MHYNFCLFTFHTSALHVLIYCTLDVYLLMSYLVLFCRHVSPHQLQAMNNRQYNYQPHPPYPKPPPPPVQQNQYYSPQNQQHYPRFQTSPTRGGNQRFPHAMQQQIYPQSPPNMPQTAFYTPSPQQHQQYRMASPVMTPVNGNNRLDVSTSPVNGSSSPTSSMDNRKVSARRVSKYDKQRQK